MATESNVNPTNEDCCNSFQSSLDCVAFWVGIIDCRCSVTRLKGMFCERVWDCKAERGWAATYMVMVAYSSWKGLRSFFHKCFLPNISSRQSQEQAWCLNVHVCVFWVSAFKTLAFTRRYSSFAVFRVYEHKPCPFNMRWGLNQV